MKTIGRFEGGERVNTRTNDVYHDTIHRHMWMVARVSKLWDLEGPIYDSKMWSKDDGIHVYLLKVKVYIWWVMMVVYMLAML